MKFNEIHIKISNRVELYTFLSVILAIIASFGTIYLWVVLSFSHNSSLIDFMANPRKYLGAILLGFMPPLLALSSIVLKKPLLMWFSFIFFLPLGLMGAASPVPAKFLGLLLIIYLFSAILMNYSEKIETITSD